ncbi:GTP-binding protein Era [Blastocystis sp. ATCC 50177/Nand II]|uniref:GTP-binding protein Era n=1 Tax=Blastocystis sp. subtype 1 (strain ATCC 50177 / NandII) TaxID=478820 RepID=A0A196SBZ4_BLAHN|nr:GTP-binding protein Era [Blastocystis sp. ATCC 50177/Nand II]
MNRLVGKKLSAVSHKVNTTRLEIMGVKNIGNTQLVFHDTPGLLQRSGSSQEEKELTSIAKQTLARMDLREVIRTATALSQSYNAHILFAINKADLVRPPQRLLQRRQEIAAEIPAVLRSQVGVNEAGDQILLLSALSGRGVGQLEAALVRAAHEGPWAFSPGVVTNRSQEEQANEVIREKAFQFLNQEIPYEIIFVHEGWRKEKGVLTALETLQVQSPSQQRIVTRAKWRIEQAAAKDLSELFGRPIGVKIAVAVEKS